MTYTSKNPATNQIYASFQLISDEEAKSCVSKAHETFLHWKQFSVQQRAEIVRKIGATLKSRTKEYAELITQEMGKPIGQAISEVEKCALICDYYADNAAQFLAPTHIQTNHAKSFIRYDPLGTVLLIMPWNFPFWQVIRAAIPAILAGNIVLLKHSRNVPRCAQEIEQLFLESYPAYPLLMNLFVSAKQIESLVSGGFIQGISLTGSTEAGIQVATYAGKHLVKTVLELGGSDPFIVLEDADLEKAVEMAVIGRFQNNGQSCIAAKRFILHEKIANKFIEQFVKKVQTLVVGDPLNPSTYIGPLSSVEAAKFILLQLKAAKDQGARVLCGGAAHSRGGAYIEPTVLLVRPEMPITQEEFFGPVALLFVVSSTEEAITLANSTKFGLGASIWTRNMSKAETLASQLDSGMVFINSIVKSDPKLPFG